ncbi:MAG: MFS transporter TsgA [Pseudomonadota bacterium]
MSNTIRVTLACFLAYFVMSGMLSPIGIILQPLSEALDLPVEGVAAEFSWLTLGILVGSAFAIVAFDVLSERTWLALVYGAIAVALIILYAQGGLWVLRLALGAVGVSCGMGLAAAASTITQLFDEERRASMLVITDGSFSAAGILISSLAVALVGAAYHWALTYLVVGVISVAVVVLVLTARFPTSHGEASAIATRRSAWPLPVWLCIASLFLYTLGQYSLLWWMPTYLENDLQVPRDEAGLVVARFWTGMFIAQLIVAWWVLRVGARRLVLLCVAGGALGSAVLWSVPNTTLLPLLSLLWGVAHLGLLKIVIAFATQAVAEPSSRLVAALLFGATSGTAVSPAVTSAIADASSVFTVLKFGTACYALLAVLILFAWITSRTRPQAAA